jgi:8-oxo-dGTP pyrophosphatase MutT (NUDIX family)
MNKLCVRCGKKGHTCKNCLEPITSFGVIVYAYKNEIEKLGDMYTNTRDYTCSKVSQKESEKYCIYKNFAKKVNNDMVFLLVERKDSISFITLIQGMYPDIEPERSIKILEYVENLTCEERYKIQHLEWDELWNIAGSKKQNKSILEKKFQNLDIKKYLDSTECTKIHANYLMPKGRLKFKESVIKGAIREFSEETGYKTSDIEIIKSIKPFQETFIGINGNTYKNVFFVSKLLPNAQISIPLQEISEQSKEVRNVGWFELKDCMDLIRDQKKKKILYQAYSSILAQKKFNVVF